MFFELPWPLLLLQLQLQLPSLAAIVPEVEHLFYNIIILDSYYHCTSSIIIKFKFTKKTKILT